MADEYSPVTYIALYGVDYDADLDGYSIGLNEQVASYLTEDTAVTGATISTFGATADELATEAIRSLDGDPEALQAVIQRLEEALD